MDCLIIHGGYPLEGEIRISGAKNSVLPVLAATLLTDQPMTISNVPHLQDVTTTIDLMAQMGSSLTLDERMQVAVVNDKLRNFFAPYNMVRTMRASILVLGPLLSRYGKVDVSLPGGCAIGTRPVNLHLAGLEALGAKVRVQDGYLRAWA